MPIYRSTRLARRGDAMDRRVDSTIAPWLLRNHFSETRPYLFVRRTGEAEQALFVNIEPRWFSLDAAYRPDYMLEIDELYTDPSHPEPFLGVEHVVTPKGVFPVGRTTCTFKTQRAAERDRSLERALAALDEHLLPWFTSVATPTAYAQSVGSDAVMYHARAHEVAGNIDLARASYEEMFQRIELILSNTKSLHEFAKSEAARTFTYLARKLERRRDDAQKLEALIAFDSRATRLASS